MKKGFIVERGRVWECGDVSPLSLTRHVAPDQSADMSAQSKTWRQIGWFMKLETPHVVSYNNLQGIRSRFGGQGDGGGGLGQREVMRNQRADIEPAGKDQARDFGLQREVGRVTADEVLLIQANGREVEGRGSRVESRSKAES